MRVYYEGSDISTYVQVQEATHRDMTGKEGDSLSCVFADCGAWMRWKPQAGDSVRITEGSHDTGILYLASVIPEAERYRVIATGRRIGRTEKSWKSYAGISLWEIITAAAGVYGMKPALWGMDGTITYPYMEQKDESLLSMAERIVSWEGGYLKCFDGKVAAIASAYAEEQGATDKLIYDSKAFDYIRRDDLRLSGLWVYNNGIEVSAYQSQYPDGAERRFRLPASDAITAGRWARGILTMENRKAERLSVEAPLDHGIKALSKVLVQSDTETAGAWIAEKAEHDLVGKTTRADMGRILP